ncbi:DUF3164 family protein [Oceaniglobus trochenteri]|uniref:DUF3164 family protein n=1 Tax=Oceaniglobus trochenteri TaxID=2763260 RepID=UPI001CFFCEAA|nr:DUF3164 family protein [Oceaniglobus trochenteri]
MTDTPQTAELWENSQGHLVPIDRVKPEDKLKDDVVRRLVSGAEALQGAMAAFKTTVFEETLATKQLILEKYGVNLGGSGGNMSLKSYDGKLEVRIAVNKTMDFGPEIDAAKRLIDECIASWTRGSNDNTRALINHAFQVDKKGALDTGRILGLQKLDMKDDEGKPDPKWARAMEAIHDAVRINGSATYVRFYRKDERTGDMKAVSLDIAKL